MQRIAFWALLVFIFMLPWERNIAIPGAGAVGTPFGALAFLLTVFSLVHHQRIRFRAPSLLLVVMGLFILWSILTYFWSINPAVTLSRSVTYFQLFIMMWLIWQLGRNESERALLLQAYVCGAYVAVFVVLLSFLRGEAYHVGFSGTRYSFGSGDPNYMAAALAVGIPMAWYLVLSCRQGFLQVLNFIYIPAAVLTIGLTGSRGGAITAIVALLVIPLTYWHLSTWRKIILLACMAAGLYSAFILLPQATLDRMLDAPEEVTSGTLTGRTVIWGAGLKILEHHSAAPVIGVGSGGFPYAVEPFLGEARAPHSAYLSILVGNGMIGIGLLLSLFVVVIIPNFTVKGPWRLFSFVLWFALAVAIIPINWENQKVMWFVLTVLTLQRAYVLDGSAQVPKREVSEVRQVNSSSVV